MAVPRVLRRMSGKGVPVLGESDYRCLTEFEEIAIF